MGFAFKVANFGPGKITGRGGRRREELPTNPWQKYKLKFYRRINGKWYKPGDWVYRKYLISPGGGYWKYGDDFDFMRGR